MVHAISSMNEFKNKISSEQLTVVDFFATWCGPCKAIAPKFQEFSEKYQNVAFLKVDVDEHNDIASEYCVTAMPTFMFFKSGNKLCEVVGASSKKLEETIIACL
ncbi:thioredoxin [Pneumocystis jirovecii RU7]|uniref:Thioredoxin n=1 Tax=Pneumocystis jirovecii (strain RU7) TaxID=1408657 RepID=A0A0W4ZFK0_PNEJ7|nr:thioredoxin [Pneumocystis jirovecii RU7]KTW27129.1 thioredoxin [Pneumocystis jirovecii RU7]